jgi:hypothetical protein
METVVKSDNIHPSLLENVTTKGFLKLMNFGLWVQYKERQTENIGLEEVIKNELKLYRNDIDIRSESKASTI